MTLTLDRIGLFTYMQSLSVGSHGVPPLSVTQPYTAMMPSDSVWGISPAFVPLVETTGTGNNAGRGETPLSGMAKIFQETLANAGHPDTTFIPYCCAPGHPNFTIDQLSKGTAPYAQLITNVTNMHVDAVRAGKTFHVKCITLIQGRQDVDRAEFVAATLQLIADLTTDIKAIIPGQGLIYFPLCQPCYLSTSAYTNSTLVMTDIAAASPVAFMCTPFFFEPLNPGDIHFTAAGYLDLGLNHIGRTVAQIILQEIAGDPIAPSEVLPLTAKYDGLNVTLTFTVPTAPLSLTNPYLAPTTDYGIQVGDDGGLQALHNWATTDTTVTFTLDHTPGANPWVDIGRSYQAPTYLTPHGASHNITDSTATTPYISPGIRLHLTPKDTPPVANNGTLLTQGEGDPGGAAFERTIFFRAIGILDQRTANLDTSGVRTTPGGLPTYALLNLPSAATYPGQLIIVSDATPANSLCVSDGSNWKFVSFGATVS